MNFCHFPQGRNDLLQSLLDILHALDKTDLGVKATGDLFIDLKCHQPAVYARLTQDRCGYFAYTWQQSYVGSDMAPGMALRYDYSCEIIDACRQFIKDTIAQLGLTGSALSVRRIMVKIDDLDNLYEKKGRALVDDDVLQSSRMLRQTTEQLELVKSEYGKLRQQIAGLEERVAHVGQSIQAVKLVQEEQASELMLTNKALSDISQSIEPLKQVQVAQAAELVKAGERLSARCDAITNDASGVTRDVVELTRKFNLLEAQFTPISQAWNDEQQLQQQVAARAATCLFGRRTGNNK